MAAQKSGTPSPESITRAHRQQIAAEEGKKAMADIEQKAVAVRANMARLRALREAKEANTAKTERSARAPKPKRTKRSYR
jgi:hypothetical protein